MFQPKTKTITIDGETVTLRQMSLAETNEINDDDDIATVIAISWVSPSGVTPEQVRKWPMSIVSVLYEVCAELNGIDEGN